jgi:hypothetical protein
MCSEFEFRSGRGVQHYVIKFVSDLRHDITKILLKVELSTIKQTNKTSDVRHLPDLHT